MDDPRGLLAIPEFWYFYQQSEDYELEEGLIKRFAPPGEDEDEYQPIVFRVECPPPFAIDIEVLLDYFTINLALTNVQTNQQFELGWWDHARWHPFGLRWIEVEHLIGYCKQHPQRQSMNWAEILLLLARFVGNGVDESEAFLARKEQVKAAYQMLNLFSPEEINQLVETTLSKPPSDDYRWTQNDQLGWVFGGEYPCYSLRNPEHTSEDEGRFPVSEFAELMGMLQSQTQ